jgi:hypothetical protein
VKRLSIYVLLITAFAPATLLAQQTSDQDVVHGAIDAGYRFTDVSGSRAKYNELFDLRSGFRVFDFSLYSAEKTKNRFYDSFFLTSSGMGGEPFSGGQFNLKKNNVYDLRVNYQQSYYYWNRNDLQDHPTGLHGLTTNHDWNTVRKIGSVNLAAYASKNLRFNFEYQQTGREGDTATTRTLDYFGAPSTWAAFLRANPYGIEAPLDEHSHRTTAGVSYSTHAWSFFYRAGYQWFEEDIRMKNMVVGERSINIDDPVTARELLTDATWIGERKLRTPISEFSYNGKLSDRIHMRGGYIFYRYHGPFSENGSFAGSARTTLPNVAPYSVTFQSQAETAENTQVIDQGFTYDVTPKFTVDTDYRYSRFNIDSEAEFQSATNGAAPLTGDAHTQWRDGIHTLDVALDFTPSRHLQIRPGIRLFKRDVTVLDDGVAEPLATKRSKIASPILTVYYSPASKLMLRGDVQNTTNGGPYTRISPRTDFNLRFIGRYQPVARVSIENNLHVRTGEYPTTDYRSELRSNTTNVTYRLNDKLSLLGGFTYDAFLATASVTFLRGPAPLNVTWRDQTIDRIWQAGIEAKPAKHVTLNLSGNYLRTTGVGEISGEPPISGPIRWPFATGTASYDFPHVGRLSLDLQRTYYIEEILKADNFNANLLTIRWTKEF